eukprot:228430_1
MRCIMCITLILVYSPVAFPQSCVNPSPLHHQATLYGMCGSNICLVMFDDIIDIRRLFTRLRPNPFGYNYRAMESILFIVFGAMLPPTCKSTASYYLERASSKTWDEAEEYV